MLNKTQALYQTSYSAINTTALPDGVTVKLLPLDTLDTINFPAPTISDHALSAVQPPGSNAAFSAVVLLQHIIQQGEQPTVQPQTVNLAALLAPLSVTSVDARTLALYRPYNYTAARSWNVLPGDTGPSRGDRVAADADMGDSGPCKDLDGSDVVTIDSMQSRAFIVQVAASP